MTPDAGDGDGRRAAEMLVDAAVDRHDALGVLVLVAGGAPPGERIADLTDEQWTGAIDGTPNQVFWGLRRALRHMIPRQRGCVLVVASLAAKMAVPGGSAEASAEHALGDLVKSAVHEVGTRGIRVNAILRGVLEASPDGDGGTAAAFAERSALKRPSRPEKVAEVAVLLASPSLASDTGCLFPVDAGSMPY